MAFPWILSDNFESGTYTTNWTSTSDTGSLLDFPHYSVLAKDPNSLMPYRGAYNMRNKLGDTNDHTITSTTIAISLATTGYFRWYMGLSRDFRFTADDVFNVFEAQQSGGTIEACVGFRVTNSTQLIEIGIGRASAPSTYVQWPGLGKHVCVELSVGVSNAGAGFVTLYLDGAQVLTLTSQTNGGAVGQGVLGSQDTLATTLGTIYYDNFVMDDARVYPFKERFPFSYPILQSGHLFVGPGFIEGATLYTISSGDESLILYDTDTGNTNDASQVVELSATAQTSVGGPLYFERGCYAALSGTNPRGMVYMTRSNEKLGVKGPMFYSNWGLRYYGNLRQARPQNV